RPTFVFNLLANQPILERPIIDKQPECEGAYDHVHDDVYREPKRDHSDGCALDCEGKSQEPVNEVPAFGTTHHAFVYTHRHGFLPGLSVGISNPPPPPPSPPPPHASPPAPPGFCS